MPAADRACKKLGQRIRALRKERELTQEAAASAADIDAKHWQIIESGKTNTTVATLAAIAGALEVRIAELFEGV